MRRFEQPLPPDPSQVYTSVWQSAFATTLTRTSPAFGGATACRAVASDAIAIARRGAAWVRLVQAGSSAASHGGTLVWDRIEWYGMG